MEKVEQMGESLGWGRSPNSWDSGEGAWRKMGEGKMRCSFWDGGPVRAASTAPDVQVRRQNTATCDPEPWALSSLSSPLCQMGRILLPSSMGSW